MMRVRETSNYRAMKKQLIERRKKRLESSRRRRELLKRIEGAKLEIELGQAQLEQTQLQSVEIEAENVENIETMEVKDASKSNKNRQEQVQGQHARGSKVKRYNKKKGGSPKKIAKRS